MPQSSVNSSNELTLKVETLIKPFTPDRPTHSCQDMNELIKLVKALNKQGFYSARQITVKEKQGKNWVPIASRFNNAWYISSGALKV